MSKHKGSKNRMWKSKKYMENEECKPQGKFHIFKRFSVFSEEHKNGK
jgi:hypothetical protein